MAKTKATIKKHLRQLRKECIDQDDLLLARVAYEVETAVRWATEDTVGWPGLVRSVKDCVTLIRREAR